LCKLSYVDRVADSFASWAPAAFTLKMTSCCRGKRWDSVARPAGGWSDTTRPQWTAFCLDLQHWESSSSSTRRLRNKHAPALLKVSFENPYIISHFPTGLFLKGSC